MRLAFVTPTLPHLPGYSGGEIRDGQLVRHLARQTTLDLYTLYGAYDSRRASVRENIANWQHPGRLDRRIVARLWQMLPTHHEGRSPYRGRAHVLAAMMQQTRPAPDGIIVSPQTNPLAHFLTRMHPKPLLILATYDVEAVRAGQLGADVAAAARFERANLAHYDGVIAVSELDRQVFIAHYDRDPARVLTIPNGIADDFFAGWTRRPAHPARVVFVGNFAYAPNVEAADVLLREILPPLRASMPDLQLWLVGAGPSAALRAAHDGQSVFVTGRVDDVRPYLLAASVICIPLRRGSGTKLKVIEALASGVPLVASSVAVEGIDGLADGVHLIIRDDPTAMRDAIERILHNPDTFRGMGERGQYFAIEHYRWSVNLAPLWPWLRWLTSAPI